MTRIAENQLARTMLTGLFRNQAAVNKASNEISSGLAVINPGDSNQSGTISLLQQTLERLGGYDTRINSLTSELTFQDDALKQVNDILARGKELAQQGANETNGVTGRAQM